MEPVQDGSDCSVVELEIPPKLSPPCIFIEEDDVILNVGSDLARNEATRISFEGRETEKNNAPEHWTVDMIRFYDDDWGDEESFIVHKIQQNMDKNPDLWKVSDKDILRAYKHKDNRSKLKCWNCCIHGHIAACCPEPYRVPKCYMCGSAGHEPKSCPHSKCLNCGASAKGFIDLCNRCVKESEKTCSRCKLQGHYFINCSDHWRKFHFTTTSTMRIPPPDCNSHKPGNEQWCCNCGKKGHNEIKCRSKKSNSHFSETWPYVACYEDLFFQSHTDHGMEKTSTTAKKPRYFEETNDFSSDSLPTAKQDDEIVVLYDGNTRTVENVNNFKNWKHQLYNRKTRNKKNKGKFRTRKEKGNNSRQKNTGKWKDLFKHRKRKEIIINC